MYSAMEKYKCHKDNCFFRLTLYVSRGWCSEESTRLPPMRPGFKSRCQCHMWVEFVAGSLPCSERFSSGYSSFPSVFKNQHFKVFQFGQESSRTRTEQNRTTLCMGYHIHLFKSLLSAFTHRQYAPVGL